MERILPDISGYLPNFIRTNQEQLNYVTEASAAQIANPGERRFGQLAVALFPHLVAYHEPGKVLPPSSARNCRNQTVPDFIIFFGYSPCLVEVGTRIRTSSGALVPGKAKQRRTLSSTGLPVILVGREELTALEETLSQVSPLAMLHLLRSYIGKC